MRKVVLVTNIPTPYRVPLFNTLAQTLRKAGMHLSVAFAAPTYARRKWRIDDDSFRFDAKMLSSDGRSTRRSRPVFLYSGLLRYLRAESPDVVIAAGFSVGTLKSWLWSRFANVPLIIWSGSEGEQRGVLGRAYRTFLARRVEGAVCYGSRARKYVTSLGIPENKTWLALNTVDVEYFRSRRRKPATPPRFVYVGDLVERKRVDLLLRAAGELSKRRQDFVLQIIGSGPLEEEMRRMANDLGISDLVRFEGYQPNDEVPRYLSEATAFLFPTDRDIWGLVLIEAMAAGLPCVASVRAGATDDVIEHGITGMAADFHGPASIAGHMQWILDHPEEATEMGRRAAEFVAEKLSLEASASGFLEAISGALQVPAAEAHPTDQEMEVAYDLS